MDEHEPLFSTLSAFNLITSTDWSDDTTRWNTGQLTLAAELCGDRITIWSGRAANYATVLVFACLAWGRLPGPIFSIGRASGAEIVTVPPSTIASREFTTRFSGVF